MSQAIREALEAANIPTEVNVPVPDSGAEPAGPTEGVSVHDGTVVQETVSESTPEQALDPRDEGNRLIPADDSTVAPEPGGQGELFKQEEPEPQPAMGVDTQAEGDNEANPEGITQETRRSWLNIKKAEKKLQAERQAIKKEREEFKQLLEEAESIKGKLNDPIAFLEENGMDYNTLVKHWTDRINGNGNAGVDELTKKLEGKETEYIKRIEALEQRLEEERMMSQGQKAMENYRKAQDEILGTEAYTAISKHPRFKAEMDNLVVWWAQQNEGEILPVQKAAAITKEALEKELKQYTELGFLAKPETPVNGATPQQEIQGTSNPSPRTLSNQHAAAPVGNGTDKLSDHENRLAAARMISWSS